jgi:gliding motility-associated-like protein
MTKQIIFIFLYLLLFFSKSVAQEITVDESNTALQLIEDVLLESSCASVSNVSVSGGNFASGELSYGSFDANGSAFPFQNGLILSTGKINNAPGPNTSILEDGGNMGWNGDTDLQDALGLSNSYNATILEFDFVPIGTKISFDYMLSSEQYLISATSGQCNFTDGFAFLLKEVGTSTYQNLAVVPGTSTPVKINTVRGSGSVCPPANEQYFDAFNGTVHPTNFNGQTKVLTAEATVIPGNTYHIKLVIADEGNYRYDSAIFLGGGSFNFGPDLGEDRTIALGNPVCSNEATLANPFILEATTTSASYQWKYNNGDILGATNATLEIPSALFPVALDGKYSVDVTIGSCPLTSSINLEFAPNLIVDESLFNKCDDDALQDGITAFSMLDFDAIKAQLFTNLPSSFQVGLFATTTSTAEIALPYTNTNSFIQTIYARITNIQNCYSYYPVNLSVSVFTDDTSEVSIGLCDGNSILLDAGSGFASYSWNTVPVQTTQIISVTTPGTYTVTLENSASCFKDRNFIVVGSEAAIISDIIINDFSENNSATIIATGAGLYEYSLDGINYQDENIFNNLEDAEYTVYVQDKNGCGIVSNTFYILDYPKFFTPNNDGYNDTWQIKNLDKRGFEASKIYIFDRYGKLLKQIAPLGNGWDGIFNNTRLPSTDYWFVLELTNGKTVKGHFALIR